MNAKEREVVAYPRSGSCHRRPPHARRRSAAEGQHRPARPRPRRRRSRPPRRTATTSPKTYLEGRLATALGGRAAEIVTFDEVTTGAENDLKQATALARRMVGLWGMSEDVGPVYLGTGEEHVFLGREIIQERAFSDATATRLDQAVRDIVEASLQIAAALPLQRGLLVQLRIAIRARSHPDDAAFGRQVRRRRLQDLGRPARRRRLGRERAVGRARGRGRARPAARGGRATAAACRLEAARPEAARCNNRRGTTLRFHPDPEIFGAEARLSPALIYRMARSKAYLFRGVEIRWRCDPSVPRPESVPQEARLHFPGGLGDFLAGRRLEGRGA